MRPNSAAHLTHGNSTSAPNRGMGSPSEPPKAGSQPSAELEVPRSGTRRARGEPDRGVEWVPSLVIRRYKQLAPFDRGEGAW